jgi:hypothetical protein
MRNVPPDDDVVFRKVDIDPLKGRRLSNPHARPSHAENKRIMFRKPLPASRLDQMQFLDREGRVVKKFRRPAIVRRLTGCERE